MSIAEISCAERLVPALLACTSLEHHKRYVVLIGGRGSSKSSVANDASLKVCDSGGRVVCAREFQKSIDQSVHAALISRYGKLALDGFDHIKNAISSTTGGLITYLGLGRNSQAVRSIHGIRLFFVDEAQFLSYDTIEEVLPSIRKTEDMDEPPTILMVGNLKSTADPFTQRFYTPYEQEIEANGFYEDDDHLIIFINYDDNPWFEESGLEAERRIDEKNMEQAEYDHKWLGKPNDSISNSIIKPEWFDACVDAHIKLGFKPRGERVVSHDPSDLGSDPKGLADLHGSVLVHVDDNPTGDVNDGADWATDYALSVNADRFLFDGDGLGVTLRRQVATALNGKHTKWEIFKGSQSCVDGHLDYEALPIGVDIRTQTKKIKEVVQLQRSQHYMMLRDRMYKTYRAVVHDEIDSPDKLFSICSDIPKLKRLRAELCRIPRKDVPGGYFQVMPKADMAKLKPKLDSPNMSDCIMMCLKKAAKVENNRPELKPRRYGQR